MNGFPDGTWGPDATLSRAQGVAILCNYEGGDGKGVAEPFDDVADGAWYRDAVAWAAANGVTDGFDERTFAPEDRVTREQAAGLVMKLMKGTEGQASSLGRFPDGGEVSGWAEGAMAWAVENGVVSGRDLGGGDVRLAPKDDCTRAEFVAMLRNAVDKGGNPGGGTDKPVTPDKPTTPDKPVTPAVDKTALREAIAKAKGLDLSKYTKETADSLTYNLKSAEQAEAMADASQSLVDQCAANLRHSITNLKLNESQTPSDGYAVADDGPGYPRRPDVHVDHGTFQGEFTPIGDYEGETYHIYCISCGYGVYIPWDIAIDNMAFNHPDWYKYYSDVLWHVQKNKCDYPRRPDGTEEPYKTWGTGSEKVWHRAGTQRGLELWRM